VCVCVCDYVMVDGSLGAPCSSRGIVARRTTSPLSATQPVTGGVPEAWGSVSVTQADPETQHEGRRDISMSDKRHKSFG